MVSPSQSSVTTATYYLDYSFSLSHITSLYLMVNHCRLIMVKCSSLLVVDDWILSTWSVSTRIQGTYGEREGEWLCVIGKDKEPVT